MDPHVAMKINKTGSSANKKRELRSCHANFESPSFSI
jgi:hypothetical protein